AIIDVIREEGLVDNAGRMGKRLRDNLEALKKDYPAMADIRGMGLMLGVEMRRGDCPDGERAGNILRVFEKRGLLMLRSFPYQAIVGWLPPRIINEQQVDEATGIFEEELITTA